MEDRQDKREDGPEKDSLVTERDIDEEFGLFQEGTFPDALPEQDQIDAIRRALPKEAGARNGISKRS